MASDQEYKKNDVLPEKFNFFHLGEITRLPQKELTKRSPFAVLFSIRGEERAHCLISFENRPSNADQESMCVEIANILSSKFLSTLIDETGSILEISPPEILRGDEKRHQLVLSMVEAAAKSALAQNYEYVPNGASRNSVPVPFKFHYVPSQKGNS